MITEQQYKDALDIVNQYRKEYNSSIKNNNFKINVYEWLKTEMMATTDITLEEFEEVLEIWISITKKKIDIEKFEKESSLTTNKNNINN